MKKKTLSAADFPQDDHDEEGNPLSDEEMEQLFDEAEDEEAENNREDDDNEDSPEKK